MDVLYYPLIKHDYDAMMTKYQCICKYMPIDEDAVKLWSRYINIDYDPNELVKIIDDVYRGISYDDDLLYKHDAIGFRIYLDRLQCNAFDIE